MKLMCVHAHFDDFEFVAGGLFTLWKQRDKDRVKRRVLVVTDGKAGHHARPREETGSIRIREQEASAAIGGYEFKTLRLADGTIPREACLQVTTPLLAALWKEIRDFQPDYLFCPPLPADPLAGVHVDHVAVAEAIRKVAYMINVPHAFTPEFPADESRSHPCKVPVIVNCFDGYLKESNAFDLAVDIGGAFDTVAAMAWCHQSQIKEWLPWVGRHSMPIPHDEKQWHSVLKERYHRQNRSIGLNTLRPLEFFTFTAWGEIPDLEVVIKDFPAIEPNFSNLESLKNRLKRWHV